MAGLGVWGFWCFGPWGLEGVGGFTLSAQNGFAHEGAAH